MEGFIVDGLTPSEIAAEVEMFSPLSESVRSLIEAATLTAVGSEGIEASRRMIDEATGMLGARQVPTLGIRAGEGGARRMWGNALTGIRNPIAPPVEFHHDGSGLVWTSLQLGPVYEGMPGIVHGGFVAMIFDHLLGEAAEAAGTAGVTGTLTVRYHRPMPIGPLYAQARAGVAEGRKIAVTGRMATSPGGDVIADAEGTYITPRWALDS
ncbi:hypothetical protein A5699_17490 [Mycobacterium sp. E802]|uniref:PaaI family thioesterase n=1 Tax=Mycobacterium sp. E802 TaxID=1834152 RepID=UPI000801FDE7|nr:PaaI family thioesterase [Mycobacterium sp. E802]OBG88372.1 hypothetical protein A5699_17490 [Mycobacterium sp. E802]